MWNALHRYFRLSCQLIFLETVSISTNSWTTDLQLVNVYIHKYHSRFIPQGIAEASQMFLRDVYILLKLLLRNTADVTSGKLIAVWSQSISGVSAINPLVDFYDIHGRKREVPFFYFVPDTTRDSMDTAIQKTNNKLILQ
jgi:hypothetical protein